MNYADASVNAKAAAWGALLNNGFLDIYTGAKPANGDAVATGTLLGTLTFGATAFGAPAAGVITANAIADCVSAAATGTAGWFRLRKSDSTKIADGDIGTEVVLDNASIVAGGRISITAFSYTEPK